MDLVKTLLALFGFAPGDTQSRVPPIFAYMAVFPAMYFAAPVGSWLLAVARVLHPHVEWGVIAVATVSTAFVVQGLIRVLVFRDTWSWLGWIRRTLLPGS